MFETVILKIIFEKNMTDFTISHIVKVIQNFVKMWINEDKFVQTDNVANPQVACGRVLFKLFIITCEVQGKETMLKVKCL